MVDNPAVQKYCYHGGRLIHWLPYIGWDDLDGEVNVTFYGSMDPLMMNEAWRTNNPRNNQKPYCVVAYMSKDISLLEKDIMNLCVLVYQPNQSWVDTECDKWDSAYGWDRAPCSACTIPNLVTKSIEFELRGLCDR